MSATREHVGTHHQHSIAGLTRLYSLNVLFSFFFFGSTRGDAEKKFGETEGSWIYGDPSMSVIVQPNA